MNRRQSSINCSASDSAIPSAQLPPPKRRACVACRRSHVSCCGGPPCEYCIAHEQPCVESPPPNPNERRCSAGRLRGSMRTSIPFVNLDRYYGESPQASPSASSAAYFRFRQRNTECSTSSESIGTVPPPPAKKLCRKLEFNDAVVEQQQQPQDTAAALLPLDELFLLPSVQHPQSQPLDDSCLESWLKPKPLPLVAELEEGCSHRTYQVQLLSEGCNHKLCQLCVIGTLATRETPTCPICLASVGLIKCLPKSSTSSSCPNSPTRLL